MDSSKIIIAVTVYHPVHSKMFPGAGGGEVRMSTAPWCPNCEIRPSSKGGPIVGEP